MRIYDIVRGSSAETDDQVLTRSGQDPLCIRCHFSLCLRSKVACSHHRSESDQPQDPIKVSTYCYVEDMSFPTVRTDRFLAPAVADDLIAGDVTMDRSSAQWLRVDGLLCSIGVESFNLAIRVTESPILEFRRVEVDLSRIIVEGVDRISFLAVFALQVEFAGALWLFVLVIELQIVVVAGTRSQSDVGRSVDEGKMSEEGDDCEDKESHRWTLYIDQELTGPRTLRRCQSKPTSFNDRRVGLRKN